MIACVYKFSLRVLVLVFVLVRLCLCLYELSVYVCGQLWGKIRSFAFVYVSLVLA